MQLRADSKTLLEPLLESVSRKSRSLLMLDYDGTIAPFRKYRDQAFPYPGFSTLIEKIVRSGKTQVAIISGRDANEIVPLLDVYPRPEFWGLHGLQRWKPQGNVELASLNEETVRALAAAEDWLHDQKLQDAAEFKTGSVAAHWRGLSEPDAATLRERVLLGWKPITGRTNLHLMEFEGGIEIRAPEADKGTAVRTILSEMEANVPAAYLGDDTTDEHAFEAMRGRGLGVLVRSRYRATAAEVWLKPPDEVFDLLERWLQACRDRDEPRDARSGALNG